MGVILGLQPGADKVCSDVAGIGVLAVKPEEPQAVIHTLQRLVQAQRQLPAGKGDAKLGEAAFQFGAAMTAVGDLFP